MTVEDKTYHATGVDVHRDAYMTVRRRSLAVGLAALVVFLLLLFDRRHPIRAALALAMGFVLFLGVMAWAQIP